MKKPLFLLAALCATLNLFSQNVGVGTNTPASKVDVKGNLTIGNGYSGTAAPPSGAIIEGPVGIGTASPDTKSALDVSSTTKGVLIPRMTTTERNNIVTPTTGLLIFNSTNNRFEFWDGTAWIPVGQGAGGPPTGAAGGDLTGTYPNPTIAPGAVNGGVGGDILDGSITTADLATPAVNATNQIFNTLPVGNGGTGTSSIPANGQILIGNGTNYNVANISGGAGINVSNGPGTITVTNTGDTNGADDINIGTAAGGDLTGTYPNPTVARIRNVNVGAIAPGNGQVLKYNSGTTQWEPATDNVNAGTVTSVSATSPISVTNPTTTPNISMTQSGTGSNGWLSSTDWNTFNNKPGGIGTLNYVPKWTPSGTALGNSQIFDNGNVGIGTNSPQEAVEIYRSGSNPVLTFHSSGVASFKMGNDANVFKIAAMDNGYGGHTGNFANNDVQVLAMTTTGQIGFGTTAPAAPFHLYGDRYMYFGPNSSWSEYLQVGGNGRVTTGASVAATNGNLHLDAKDGGFATYINYYSQNNTYINAQAGNVGIGNAGPSTKLHVSNGAIRIGVNSTDPGATDGVLSLGNTAVNYNPTTGNWTTSGSTMVLSAQDYSTIGFHDAGSRVDFIRTGAGVMQLGYNGGWGAATIQMPSLAGGGTRLVTTDNAGTIGATAMPGGVLPAGSVGNTLYHNGSSWVATSNLYNNGSQINLGQFTTADNDEWPYVTWLRNTGAGWDDGLIKASSAHGIFGRVGFGIHMDAGKQFGFYSSGWDPLWAIEAASGRMYVKGNAGIGTNNPGYKLHVNGTAGLGQTYMLNSDMYFTNTGHNHTGLGNTAGYAAIENAANYNTLMILGRANGIGGVRSVSIWDRLDVNGNTNITGQLTVAGGGLFSGTAYTRDWGDASGTTYGRVYANNDNAFNGGLSISDDGGFYDRNDGWIRFDGSTGIVMDGNNGTGIMTYDMNDNAGIHDKQVVTTNAAWGVVGTSGNYWYYMYAGNYYYGSRRELKRDINPIDGSLADYVMNDLDRMKPSFYKLKVDEDQWVEGNETKFRPNYHLGLIVDESPDYIQDQTFSGLDLASVATLGVLGAKINREEIKEIKTAIGMQDGGTLKAEDFGEVTLQPGETFIPFEQDFAQKLGSVKPVVTVTPSQTVAGISIVEKTDKGFKVKLENNTAVSVNWIAMARIQTTNTTVTNGEEPISAETMKGMVVDQATKDKIHEYWQKNKEYYDNLRDGKLDNTVLPAEGKNPR